jgi:hypothetical protein
LFSYRITCSSEAGSRLRRVVLAQPEPRHHVDLVLLLRRVEDEHLAVLLELRVERHPQQPFFIRVVVVLNPVLDIQEHLRLGRLLVVREDVNRALLDGDEHAVRAVAGVGQHDGA